MPLQIVFLGTGTFAQPAFEALVRSSHSVTALVTQPDRTGPGGRRHPHPLRHVAEAAGVPVLQPANVNLEPALAALRALAADLFVVAAYGQILRPALLEIPRLGAINLHASLLPRHRGAAPINFALLAGDVETGVSVFQIEPRVDAGPVLGMARLAIGAKQTAGELEEELARLAAPLAVDVVDQLEAGTSRALPQNAADVTRAPKLSKLSGRIDWNASSLSIERHIRALQPWPGSFAFLHSPSQAPLRIVLWDVDPCMRPPSARQALPGDVLPGSAGELLVATGDSAVTIRRLQPAGKRVMDISEFLRGRAVPAGSRLGDE